MRKLLSFLTSQSGVIHTLPLLVIVAAVGIISYLLISSAAPFKGGLFGTLNPRPESKAAGGCTLSNGATPVFCETFDNPAPVALRNRSGQLDGTLWGTSRIEGGISLGSGIFNAASVSTMDACGTTYTAQPGTTDVIVCNGQLRESSYDEHGVSTLAIYPKQPFDFANRTGIVSFDVSNDNTGSHGTWPEFWITDQPVPAPFTHGGDPSVDDSCDLCSVAKNGLGIDFSASIAAGKAFGGDCPTENTRRWTVSSYKFHRNYSETIGQLFTSDPNFQSFGCVRESTGPNDALNHVEVRISQNHIEVWATNPGETTLHHLSTYNNANLSFTKGVIWLEDSHYNAEKAEDPSTGTLNLANHTFAWDNVAFDGPATYRDISLDVLDALQPTNVNTDAPGLTGKLLNLGWSSPMNNPVTLTTVSGFTQAHLDYGTAANKGALLLFNMGDAVDGHPLTTINYTINGHNHTQALPFSVLSTQTNAQGQRIEASFHSVGLPVPFSDLVVGPQTIKISGDDNMMVTNVNLVLLAGAPVPGAGPTPTPCPSCTPAPTSSPTPVLTPTPIPTPTPVPTPTLPSGPSATPGTNSFTGEYWNSSNGVTASPSMPTTAPNLVRNDPTINFNFGTGSPAAGINADHFVARWTGKFNFNAGNYTFSAAADDGVRLYIDNNLIIDQWRDQGPTTYTSSQALIAGTHTVKMEYYEDFSGAVAQLNWNQSSGSTPAPTPIPTPTTQTSVITITAGGQAGVFNNQTIRPTMILQVNGVNKQTWNNVGGNGPANQFLTFTYNSSTKVTHDQVRVRFTNDQYNASIGQDVNLWIKQINVDGTNYPSNAPSVFSNGVWTPSTGCSGGFKQSIELSCNGFFQY